MAKDESGVSNNLRKIYRRLQRWRSSHTGRLPIPESLWAAAAELAREHGIFPTAKALHRIRPANPGGASAYGLPVALWQDGGVRD